MRVGITTDLSAVFSVLSREHGRMSGLPESLRNFTLDRRMTCARPSQARPAESHSAALQLANAVGRASAAPPVAEVGGFTYTSSDA
jgi:hypothetical protein